DVAPRDFFEDTKSLLTKATSAVDAAKSLAGGVPDVIESAANAAATGVQVAIESHLPKNISLGTQDLCIGFTKNLTCKPLPLNLTELLLVDNLPDTFQSIVQDKVDSLQPFATALTNVVYIRILLIV